jgi:hypothetical protein
LDLGAELIDLNGQIGRALPRLAQDPDGAQPGMFFTARASTSSTLSPATSKTMYQVRQ